MNESTLTERLRALPEPLSGANWLDVERRARNRRGRSRRVVLVAAALVLALLTGTALALRHEIADLLRISSAEPREVPVPRGLDGVPTVRYAYGNVLFGYRGGPRTLAAPIQAPLLGYSRPVVWSSADGRLVAYPTSSKGKLALRLYNVESGDDTLLAEGGVAAAWREDGALAYAQLVPPDKRLSEQSPFPMHVYLRSGAEAELSAGRASR